VRDYEAGLGWLVREERNNVRQSTRLRPSARERIEGAHVGNPGSRNPRGMADLICTSATGDDDELSGPRAKEPVVEDRAAKSR
jgi:hypothetical protein